MHTAFAAIHRPLPSSARPRLLAATLMLIVLFFARPGHAGPPSMRIAVMDFSSSGASGELSELGAGLQSMITTDLTQVSTLTVVERARLQEVQKELRLSHSKAVDPSTAARLGKLAGATHLVVGTFAVVGKSMRLDGRMVEVVNGKVTVAASAEGEKDAFFELEKTLVSKFVAALNVKVTPKERGDVAKIHTTDFEAFRQFGIGVRLSDDKKYDEAMAAMKAALKKDEDFRLARMALSEYERLAAELRSRATDIEDNARNERRLQLQGEAADQRKVVEKLFELTRATGDKSRLRRAEATYMLACAYQDFGQGMGYWGVEDSFANWRMREALAARYYPDALALWPKLHLHPHCLSQIGPDRPRTTAKFEEEFKSVASNMAPRLEHLKRIHEAARLFRLDARGQADLADRYYELGLNLNPPVGWRREMLEMRASLRRAILDFDQSTRLYKQAADLPYDNTWAGGQAGLLRRYAEFIDANGKLSKLLESLPAASVVREYARAESKPSWNGVAGTVTPEEIARFQRQPPDKSAQSLTSMRSMDNEYVFIGRSPVWKLGPNLWTGPRSDIRRADQLRYLGQASPAARSTFVVVDGTPRRDVGLSFDLTFSPPADFQPFRGGDPAPRPQILVLFSATCVDCDRTPDPATGSWRHGRQPVDAWGVAFGADRTDLVKVAISSIHERGREPDQIVAKASQPVGFGSSTRSSLSVRVQGNSVVATVAGKSTTFPLPADVGAGFYGLLMRGPGFAGIDRLQSSTSDTRGH